MLLNKTLTFSWSEVHGNAHFVEDQIIVGGMFQRCAFKGNQNDRNIAEKRPNNFVVLDGVVCH